MSLTLAILLAVSAFTPGRVLAFEALPEFQSLTEAQQAEFDRPSLLGAEYQSDVLAFLKQVPWEHLWLSHDLAFDSSLGSISAVHFLIDTRLKINHFLSELLQIRLTYFDERNHDRQAMHFIPELVFWPWQKVGISLYGEPSYAKRENDLGLALLWRPTPGHELRLFNTWVDVTRQKRSDRSDTFDDGQLPYARGLVGRRWSDGGDFLEYAVRHETKTKWIFKEERYDYRYWRGLISGFFNHRLSANRRLNARVQLDRKFETREPGDAWLTDRVQTQLQFVFEQWGPHGRWTLTPGLMFAHRRWSTPRDTLSFHDYLPHLWLMVPVGDDVNQNYFQFQYDLAWHRKNGGAVIGPPTDKDAAVNQRLNIIYAWLFQNRAELRLIVGLDLDAFGTSDTWQAGSGQFRLNF